MLSCVIARNYKNFAMLKVQIMQAEKPKLPTKVFVGHLEVHVSHLCNLRCKGCTHYCDIGYAEKIDHDAALDSLKAWARRIHIKQFAMLGGEPLLEKRLPEYIKLASELFYYAERRVVTNGVLLHKWDDSLPKLISETGTRLIVSLHLAGEKRKEEQAKSFALLKEWVKKYDLDLTIKDIDYRWFRIYQGQGLHMRPFEDNRPETSRANCVTPCVNLHKGALWKCPPLAYLPMVIDKLKYKKDWEPYLQYRPLTLEATDDELCALSFDTACCGMCPAAPATDLVQSGF